MQFHAQSRVFGAIRPREPHYCKICSVMVIPLALETTIVDLRNIAGYNGLLG